MRILNSFQGKLALRELTLFQQPFYKNTVTVKQLNVGDFTERGNEFKLHQKGIENLKCSSHFYGSLTNIIDLYFRLYFFFEFM